MRKARVILLAVALAALQAVVYSQTEASFNEVMEWRTQAMNRAKAGEMKWSDYYSQAYDKTSKLTGNPLIPLDLQLLAELIPIARKYESGEITADQFQDAKRLAAARFRSASSQLEQSNDQARTAEEQARRAAAIQMLSNMPRPQPITIQPYQMPTPAQQPSTNCTSYVSGGQLITNCR